MRPADYPTRPIDIGKPLFGRPAGVRRGRGLRLAIVGAIVLSWVVLSPAGSHPVAAAGEPTTPILQYNGATIGAVHTTADGRESIALTFDHAPNLRHSLLLNY